MKNQDITIRKLEETIEEYKESIEDKVQEAVTIRTAEIEEASSNQVREVRENHHMLEKRLASAVEAMKQAQASADRAQTHLFETTSQSEMRISAMQSERDLQSAASERADARIAELEKEIEVLKSISTIN